LRRGALKSCVETCFEGRKFMVERAVALDEVKGVYEILLLWMKDTEQVQGQNSIVSWK
jgi:hypothetical protein